MARRSLRQQTVSAKSTPSKRSVREEANPRPTKRSKASPKSAFRATRKKSANSEQEVTRDELQPSSKSESGSSIEEQSSGYADEDEDASTTSPDSDALGSEEYDSSEEERPIGNRRAQKAANKGNGKYRDSVDEGVKGSEVWRPGVKAGLGPGTQVIIQKPKARPAGKVPYGDDTIHPNTMLFLKDLAAHNDRDWLKMHDADYRTSLNDFNSFVERLTGKVIEADGTIPELPVKDIVFRIYRDIRFTPDPTPYKTHFSAAWSRTGRKGPYAAYYLHVQPGESFLGGGLWQPDSQSLARLRTDVDRKSHKIRRVLTDPRMRKEFLGGIPNDEKKAIKAFVSHNAESALKTKPKGYDAENPNIELLRLKNFTVGSRLQDHEVTGSKGLERVAELISCLVPFITYLNSVVVPDNPDDEDDDGDDGDGDDAGDSEHGSADSDS